MSPFRAALAALLAALLAGLPGAGAQVAPADPAAPVDAIADPAVPAVAFPAVPGVDLVALGYDGPPLEALLPLVMPDASATDLGIGVLGGDPLPADQFARAAAASAELTALVEPSEALPEVEALLVAVVAALDLEVGVQRAAEALAAERVALAADRLVAIRGRLRAQQAALDDHRQRMAEAAVAAYIRPPDADTIDAVLGTGAASTAQVAAPVLHEATIEHDRDVQDHFEVEIATLGERLASLAADASARRARHRVLADQLAVLAARRDAHREGLFRTQAVREAVDGRIAELEAVLDELAEAFALADESILAASRSAAAEVPVVVVPSAGIRVHAAIAPRLAAMVAAAEADGVILRGWGHRSHESQIRLRVAHCGPTPADVWLTPAGACSPPTAIPGTSMHEIGLAVDFTHDGAAITSHDSPAYQWLAANASTFGFVNLPSEPWHWSVNGR